MPGRARKVRREISSLKEVISRPCKIGGVFVDGISSG
jgi:hypothetical protein